MNRLNTLAINSEGFIFDPTTGESFTVNPTALFILNGLKVNKSPEQIAEEMKNEFEDVPDEIEKDISEFVTNLRTYSLV